MSDYSPWGKNVLDEYEIKERAKQIVTKIMMEGLTEMFFITPQTVLNHDRVSHLSYDLSDDTRVKLINKVTAILSQRV